MTTEKLKSQVWATISGGVAVTADNLESAKKLIAAERKRFWKRKPGEGHIDCRRWGPCASLGYPAFHCGIDAPKVGDILVSQCSQIG